MKNYKKEDKQKEGDFSPAILAQLNLPLVEVDKKPGHGFYIFIKRVCDILFSATFLIVFSWLYLLLILLVIFCGEKPFYKHQRVGKNGKNIYIHKFTTMKSVPLGECALTNAQYVEYKREFKLDNDPRLTKIGKFLRETSLDELPQMWDVLIGTISLVGPRPLLREELEEKYVALAPKIISVKPGMVGWWSANGRNNRTYASGERQKLELYYVENCCFGLDVKIFFKTILVVFTRKGAK